MSEARYSVLVVDDEPAIRNLVSEAVQVWGHQVRACASADEAIGILSGGRFDAAIMDVRMPGMDGHDLLRHVVSCEKDLAVVVMSASPEPEIPAESFRRGADEFLRKPFALDDLRSAIDRAIESKRQRSASRIREMQLRDELARLRDELYATSDERERAEVAFRALLRRDRHPACLVDGSTREVIETSAALDELLGLGAGECIGSRIESLDEGGNLARAVGPVRPGETEPVVSLRRRGLPPCPASVRAESIAPHDPRVLLTFALPAPSAEPAGTATGRSVHPDELARLLSWFSHEFRTPLAAIVGHTDVLELIDGNLEPRQLKSLHRIRVNALYLLQLANQLLDLSLLEMGKLDLEPDEVDVRSLVEDVVTTLAPLAEEKGLALSYSVGDGDPRIRTDPCRARQILLNLVGNAVKYTRIGGVCVEALRDDRDPDTLRILVKDTGIGIGEDEVAHLFEEFRTAHPPGEADTRGIGLGLAISRTVAEALGGTIEVESEKGKGSVFTLTLPSGKDPALPATGTGD